MSVQCITCAYCVMDENRKGMGLCWKESGGTRNPRDVLMKRNCKLWKLGAMHSVKARSVRRIVFKDDGIARLT